MITIINYGLGNVFALMNLYQRLGIQVQLANEAARVRDASKLILPGVGAFDHAMEKLDASGMRPSLEERIGAGAPVLGICVGMQMLAESSEEGTRAGLGLVPGRVRRFDGSMLALPHMGWNDVVLTQSHGLFAGLEDDARFYFLHSYYFDCGAPEHSLATAEYGSAFTCSVGRGSVLGVQFHPEKSHHWGVRLLENFAKL